MTVLTTLLSFFAVILHFAVFANTQLGEMGFEAFATFETSVWSTFNVAIGTFDYEQVDPAAARNIDPGIVYVVRVYLFFMLIVLFLVTPNILLGIVMDAYNKVRLQISNENLYTLWRRNVKKCIFMETGEGIPVNDHKKAFQVLDPDNHATCEDFWSSMCFEYEDMLGKVADQITMPCASSDLDTLSVLVAQSFPATVCKYDNVVPEGVLEFIALASDKKLIDDTLSDANGVTWQKGVSVRLDNIEHLVTQLQPSNCAITAANRLKSAPNTLYRSMKQQVARPSFRSR